MTPRDTRERLIMAAMELFYLNGYEATSVAEILEKAGAGSGSLYYFFKDKEDLAYAVANMYHEMLFDVLYKPVYEAVKDPIERIFTVLANYRRGLVESEFSYGCPIGNLALEVSQSLPRVAERLGDNFDGWAKQMHILLEMAEDQFPDDVDLRGVATLILTTMEGGVMLSRTQKKIAPYDTAVAQLRDYLERLMAHAEVSST